MKQCPYTKLILYCDNPKIGTEGFYCIWLLDADCDPNELGGEH